MASAPSGDWRPIGGQRELIAISCVNSPGFPRPRALVRKQDEGLVASILVLPPVDLHFDERRVIQRIAKSINRDTESRLAALTARVHPEA